MNLRPFLAALALLPTLSCATTSSLVAPVGIAPNGRHFVDGRGKPLFWMGDTQWELFRAFPEEEARAILDDRRKKGFNVLQVMILGVHGMKKANAAGEKPFLNGDVSAPNEAYFAAADRIVKHAERLGQILVVGVYHKSPDTGPPLTLETARRWGAWVGRRYREAPNVIWSMYPEAKAASLPIVREIAAGLAEGDGGRHLLTAHPDPAPASSSWIHDEPWLSFNTLQSFKSDFLNYRMVAADVARTPVKVVVNGEARYEEEGGTTPLQVRRGAWWSVLAGGFYTYGHGGNWQKPGEWKRWIGAPGAGQMTILRDFFESLSWWTLTSDPSILVEAADGVVAARAADHSWTVVYYPSRGSATLSRAVVSLASEVSWMNPAGGATQPAGPGPSFIPPDGWDDAVLLLRARNQADFLH